MNYRLTLWCALVCTFIGKTAGAQLSYATVGEFSQGEKQLKTVSFDPDADGVYLHDVARASYNDSYNLELERHIRIKVLKPGGTSLGNIEIPYYSKDNFEYVSNITAVVYSNTEDGHNPQITQLKSSEIFRQKINDRWSMVKFAMPNVKVGSIIDYKYLVTSKNYNGLESWYFQRELPTLYSGFQLFVVPNASFSYRVFKSPDLPINIENVKGSGSVKFEMRNIAGLRNEAYMDAPRDYLQHVDFQLSGYVTRGGFVNYMQKWEDVSKELLSSSHFGSHLEKKLGDSEELVASFAKIESHRERLGAVHQYMTKQFTWNGMHSKFADDDLKNTWESRQGSSGALNLVMLNLMRRAGLQASPLLVSDRRHGRVDTAAPMIDQFNRTVALVVVDNMQYVVDASDERTPLNLIPATLLNTTAFLVDKKNGRLVKLRDQLSANATNISLKMQVNPDGSARGEALMLVADHEKLNFVQHYKDDKSQYKARFAAQYSGVAIDSLTMEQAEYDSIPLQQRFTFTRQANSSGDYKLVEMNLFTGFEKNPFISDNRFTDVNFGSQKVTTVTSQVTLPANLKPEAMPKPVRMILPDKSLQFTRTCSMQDNTIFYTSEVRINRPVFTAAEYPDLKQFYKLMFDYLNEPVVLISR